MIRAFCCCGFDNSGVEVSQHSIPMLTYRIISWSCTGHHFTNYLGGASVFFSAGRLVVAQSVDPYDFAGRKKVRRFQSLTRHPYVTKFFIPLTGPIWYCRPYVQRHISSVKDIP